MGITVKNNQFHLTTKKTSYIISVFMDRYLANIYWGKKLITDNDYSYILDMAVADRAASIHPCINEDKKLFLSDVPLEFSTVSEGLYRLPSCRILDEKDCSMSQFEYESYHIYDGKSD